jgi:prevent-host-death family protein
MNTMSASDFKAHCLAVLDRVAEANVEYLITKHGRPVAKVVPVTADMSLLGRVTVLVDRENEWFSTADLVDPIAGEVA